MCGIAGEIRFDAKPDADALRRMTDVLAHRGPDDHGFFLDGAAGLGHRRLSILDIAGGSQPMLRENCAIVFNGEAYEFEELKSTLKSRGHLFTTRSDTEVVLRAYLEWGDQFVERVHGMFALAIWDGRHQRLLLARDRLGKKPLYFALGHRGRWEKRPGRASEGRPADRLLFGSELKALLAHGALPRQLDAEAFVQYLAMEYVPAPDSIFENVSKLPAAHIALFENGRFSLRRYWQPPAPSTQKPLSPAQEKEAAVELLSVLDTAVARRLVADVPVGVFLSGGIDSSAIAALAVRHHQPLSTFSIAFGEKSFDESPFARLAAERFGTQHHTEILSSDACLEEIPNAVACLDEPFADPSILPTLLLSRFVRKNVTVALAGDGGDELFAGYDPFLAHRSARWAAHLPRPVQQLLRGAAALLPSSAGYMSLDFRLKQFLRGVPAADSLRHQVWIGAFIPEELAAILPAEFHPLLKDEIVYREVLAESRRAAKDGILPGSVDEALRFYLTRYLADDILVKADRAGMAASLEVRAPFLDTHLVELVARLPWSSKLKWNETKVLLRRALRGVVPEEILTRPKQGFGIPIAAWIRGGLRDLFEDLFSPASLGRSGVLRVELSRALFKRHLAGQVDLRKPLWTLAMFLLWQRRWCFGRGDAASAGALKHAATGAADGARWAS